MSINWKIMNRTEHYIYQHFQVTCPVACNVPLAFVPSIWKFTIKENASSYAYIVAVVLCLSLNLRLLCSITALLWILILELTAQPHLCVFKFTSESQKFLVTAYLLGTLTALTYCSLRKLIYLYPILFWKLIYIFLPLSSTHVVNAISNDI